MKKFLVVIVLLFFAMPARAGIVYFDGFENGFKSYNTGVFMSDDHCCDHSLTTGDVSDGFPVYSGNKSMRSYIQAGDSSVKGHTARAELTGWLAQTEEGAWIDDWNNDRWYGFSVYIQDRGAGHFYKGDNNFFQLHHYSAGDVPFTMHFRPGLSGSGALWEATGFNPNYTAYFQVDATNDVGKWTHFIFNINWGKNNGWVGKFKIWKNGVLMFNKDPFINNMPGRSDDHPPYVKIGTDYPGEIDDYPMYNFHDNFTVGDKNSSLLEMQEVMRGETPPQEIRADVDQSGIINTTDAMLTLRNSLGLDMSGTNWQASATTGDVNCDGSSNSTDAMLILRYSVGLSMSGTGWCEA